MKEFTEQELIRGCKKGDSRFQRLFFDRYYSAMYAICMRFAKNNDEAKDILQEGFIRAFEGLHAFKGESSIATWLSKIMVNQAISYVKKKNKSTFNPLPEDEYNVAHAEEEETSLLDTISPKEALQLLQQLPDGYRTVINLYAVEGLNHKQISQQLGISEGTSKSQLSKARQLLKKFLTRLNTYVI